MSSIEEKLLEFSDSVEALMQEERDLDNELANLLAEQRITYNKVKCPTCQVTSTEHPGITLTEVDMVISRDKSKKISKKLEAIGKEIEDTIDTVGKLLELLIEGTVFSVHVDLF